MLFFSCISGPPGLAEKLETWRSFVDGPIEAVELDCDHDHMLLPEPVARIGLRGQRRMRTCPSKDCTIHIDLSV